jgi:hypothetical protein
MPSTSSAAAAAAAAALEAPVAGTTVDLSDVSDPTISTLWKRIYANLSSDQIGEGMIVCKAFKQLLVRDTFQVDSMLVSSTIHECLGFS